MLPYFPDCIQTFDISVLNWIQEHITNPFCDAVLSFISMLGDYGLLWIVAAVVMLFFKKTRKTGLMVGAALILGLIFGNGILKNAIGRIRPYDLENAMVTTPLIHKPSDLSFPSGHSLASFEFATVIFIRDKRFGIPLLILAALIAFSRIYFYIHFPTDIICGALLGVVNGILAALIVNTVWNAVAKRKTTKKLS